VLLQAYLYEVIEKLFLTYGVDKHHIHILRDDGESIKTETVRRFIQQSHLRSSDRFQIFVVENISRLTLSSGNASLKFLEEP
jgi:DNA polymerase III gamma/tau subunit